MGREPDADWLGEALRSAVHHARRDTGEATLMRLAKDALLLADHLHGEPGTGDGPLPNARLTPDPTLTPSRSGSARTDHAKLAQYRVNGTPSFQGETLEAFHANAEDRRLALDAEEPPPASPAPRPRRAFPFHLALAAIVVLILCAVTGIAVI